MPVELYRRHSQTCKYAEDGQKVSKCLCPIWCYGTVKGKVLRRSMKSRNWSVAVARAEALDRDPTATPVVSLRDAARRYLKDCAGRGLEQTSIGSRRRTLERLIEFMENRELNQISSIRLVDLENFRDSRKIKPNTKRKEIEYIRFLYNYCLQHRWIEWNVARDLKAPKAETGNTMPYEREEIDALLEACSRLNNINQTGIARARSRAKALLLLLLYSGLRISDAVKLERNKLGQDGRLQIRTKKNNVNVYVRLHPECVAALNSLPAESIYFFWSGKSQLSTAIGSARRTISAISKLAKVPARPHRFRDTFAVELLLLGEDIRTVQLLLGHSSVKTTEKYYAPYVARFQTILDQATGKLDFRSMPRGSQ